MDNCGWFKKNFYSIDFRHLKIGGPRLLLKQHWGQSYKTFRRLFIRLTPGSISDSNPITHGKDDKKSN